MFGGIASYPLKAIYREVAFIAYHFHWSMNEILEMPHSLRRKWIHEISNINKERNKAEENAFQF